MTRTSAWFLLAAGLCWAPGAAAVTDVPTSDRRALEAADLASGSGLTRPLDTAVLPLDDSAYLEVYRALERVGLRDPDGARRDALARERADGGLASGGLLPSPELRAFVLGGADERPLHHASGDVLERGMNVFLSAEGDGAWDGWLGGGYTLQASAAPGDLGAEVKRLYLKGRLGKWSLKVGRDAVRLGPGYHGSLLVDDNAFPLDLWQVRTEEPVYLPWFLSKLGGFRIALFNAYLSDEHPAAPDPRYDTGAGAAIEDARLLGMRLSYHPASWLDLGLSRSAFYGGKGRETYDTPRDWWELFAGTKENVRAGEDDRYDNDQYAALDVTVRLPFLNGLGPLRAGKLYWEYAGTDLIANWKGGSGTGNWEPFNFDDVANLAGAYLSTAVTDLRVEFAQTSAAWYRHHEYAQGYSYRGLPLGHHMGGDARNLFAELSRWVAPDWRVTLGLDAEERGRSLSEPEKRLELTAAVEALGLRLAGVPLTGRLEALWGRVQSPLDEADRDDRSERFLGITLSGPLAAPPPRNP